VSWRLARVVSIVGFELCLAAQLQQFLAFRSGYAGQGPHQSQRGSCPWTRFGCYISALAVPPGFLALEAFISGVELLGPFDLLVLECARHDAPGP
jgi:hypothetical protein